MSHYTLSGIHQILQFFESFEGDIPPSDLINSLKDVLKELKNQHENIVSTQVLDQLLILELQKKIPELEVVSIYYRDFLYIWKLYTKDKLQSYVDFETYNEIELVYNCVNNTCFHRYKSDYLHPTVKKVLNIH